MNMMSYIDQLLEKISWIKNVAEKGTFDKRKKDEKRVYILYLYLDQNRYLFKISNINCCFIWWNLSGLINALLLLSPGGC